MTFLGGGMEQCSEATMHRILDHFRRYVVGWMVAKRESSTLAQRLTQEGCEERQIESVAG